MAVIGDSPLSIPDGHAVLRQLERLLEHPAFHKSVRCTKLLRYLVEQSLQNPGFHPKERMLAIEVFGRSPDYDTAADPIVRTTANEIRKRLGSYFHDTGAAAEVLIELRSGSYRPSFRAAAPPTTAERPAIVQAKPGTAFPTPRSRRYLITTCLTAAAAILLIGVLLLRSQLFLSNSDRFWRPFLSSSRPVLVCPPDPELLTATKNLEPNPTQTPMISMSDSKAVWRVLSVLNERQKNSVVRSSDRVQAKDLLDGPAIVIGGRNNPWSVPILSRLRFQIAADESTRTMRIVDQINPSEHEWTVDLREPSSDGKRIFALITRVIDPATANAMLNIAGIGTYATAAGGAFIAEPHYLNGLGNAFKGCDDNLQLIVSARVTNGIMGEPKVEAIHCW